MFSLIRPNVYRDAGFVFVLLMQVGCIQWEPLTRHFAAIGSDRGTLATRPISAEEVEMKLALARSLERGGETDRAIAAFKEIIDQHDSAVAFHRLGVLYDRQESFDQSELMYREALSRDPANPDLLCDAGYSYYLRGLDDESEALLRKSVQLSPSLKRAHNNLGLLLARRQQYDAALSEFAVASESHGQDQLNLAYAMALTGDTDRASDRARSALESDSSSQPAREMLATTQPVAPNESQRHKSVDRSSLAGLQNSQPEMQSPARPEELRQETMTASLQPEKIVPEFRRSVAATRAVKFDESAKKPALAVTERAREGGLARPDSVDRSQLAERQSMPSYQQKTHRPQARPIDNSPLAGLQDSQPEIQQAARPLDMRHETMTALSNAEEIATEFRMSPTVDTIVTFDTSARKPTSAATKRARDDGWLQHDSVDHSRLAERQRTRGAYQATHRPPAQPAKTTTASAGEKDADPSSKRIIAFVTPAKKPIRQVTFGD